MRLYIAGPMTGIPHYNFGAFFDAAARLNSLGIETVNPAEHDEVMGWVVVERDGLDGILRAYAREEGAFDWATALDWDLKAIDASDGIYLLPGWSKSRGATKEYEHAARSDKLIFGAINERAANEVRHQPLVGLVGYAQSGKDTFAGYLGYRRIAFADPLKQLAAACDPLVGQPGWDDACGPLSEVVAEHGWEYAKAKVTGVREFLQHLGVGAREVIDPEVWVKAAFAKYDPTQPTVITDVRFPNEIAAIRDRGGVIVRIDRVGNTPPNGHVSEFAWQATEPDYQYTFANGDLPLMETVAASLDRRLRGF